MPNLRSSSLAAFLLPSLSVPAPAQAPGVDAAHAEAAIVQNVGLHLLDGELVGAGPGYAARFEGGTFRYTPAFGTAAPRTMPWEFRLESVGRDGETFPVATPRRDFADFRVRYLRSGFEEHYDLRLEGVEQSFVFHQLPPGTGDLVVRGRVDTELVGRVDGEGLRFEYPGIGAVTVGEITGIDARGRRASGTMRWDGDMLELTLPGELVDEAALPLVLDPLIGTEVTVSGTSTALAQDVAALFVSWPPRYFVVWEHVLSATDSDIRGQRLVDGALDGGVTIVTSGTTNDIQPKVATVRARSSYVVVWTRVGASSNNVMARAVRSANGAVGAIRAIPSGSGSHVAPDVGGESASQGTVSTVDQVTVVWLTAGQLGIRARRVRVEADGLTLTPFVATQVLVPGVTASCPAISKSGGEMGNHMVVFCRYPGGPGIGGVLLNRNLGMLEDLLDISTGAEDVGPEVDGDGRNWVVAWERREPGASVDRDIFCRSVGWNPAAPLPDQGYLISPETVVEADPGDDEQHPSVAWLGGSALVAYSDFDPGAGGGPGPNPRYVVLVRSIDPFQCTACEGTLLGAFASTVNELTPAVCSQLSGGESFDSGLALITARRHDFLGQNVQIQAREFVAHDGTVTELFCIHGGRSHASCARVGNGSFDLRLTSSRASAPAFLVLGVDRLGLSCGGCTIVPDPWTGVVLGGFTDARGGARQSLAIPNQSGLIGLPFHTQWLVADPSCSSCCFGFALSTGLTVTIQ